MEQLKSLFDIEKCQGCSITAILTRHCNLRCSHCNIHEWLDNKEENFYDLSILKSFINKLKSIGKKNFAFNLIGGEVLSKFDRLNNFISEFKDYKLTMTTNLVDLPEDFEILKNVDVFVTL